MSKFAVNRDEIPRPNDIEHGFELFAVSVPGHMYVSHLLMDYFSPLPIKMVYDVLDGPLVSGNELG
jgi:hypothetical protein